MPLTQFSITDTPQHAACCITTRTLPLSSEDRDTDVTTSPQEASRCPSGDMPNPLPSLWGCLTSWQPQESPSLWAWHFQSLCQWHQRVLSSFSLLACILLHEPPVLAFRVTLWRTSGCFQVTWRYKPMVLTVKKIIESELHGKFQVSLGDRMRSYLKNKQKMHLFIWVYVCMYNVRGGVHAPWRTRGGQRTDSFVELVLSIHLHMHSVDLTLVHVHGKRLYLLSQLLDLLLVF